MFRLFVWLLYIFLTVYKACPDSNGQLQNPETTKKAITTPLRLHFVIGELTLTNIFFSQMSYWQVVQLNFSHSFAFNAKTGQIFHYNYHHTSCFCQWAK